VTNVGGTWKDLTGGVNIVAADDYRYRYDRRPRSDLTQKIIGVSVSGEMLNLISHVIPSASPLPNNFSCSARYEE